MEKQKRAELNPKTKARLKELSTPDRTNVAISDLLNTEGHRIPNGSKWCDKRVSAYRIYYGFNNPKFKGCTPAASKVKTSKNNSTVINMTIIEDLISSNLSTESKVFIIKALGPHL